MRVSTNSIYWIVVVALFSAASFFTMKNIIFKQGLHSVNGARFESGKKVIVERILDSDEISVKSGETRYTVRILGVKSFESTANDTVVQAIGKMAFNHLGVSIGGNEVELVFDEFKKDPEGRILAYVHRSGVDVGLDLVQRGYTLVFTKYPFSRMKDYLAAEQEARSMKMGLWADPAVTERSLRLKALWERGRE